MKLYNVEASGLKKVVFDKTTVYTKDEKTGNWQRTSSPRDGTIVLDHSTMAKCLTNISLTDGYRVRLDMGTANVYSQDRCDRCCEQCDNGNETVPTYRITVYN